MIFDSFEGLVKQAQNLGSATMAVAAAHDRTVIKSVLMAKKMGIADSILVGDESRIRLYLEEAGFVGDIEIINVPDPSEASLRAASIVGSSRADFLMKGMVNTSDYLRAVLDKKSGLRTGKTLSMLAAFDVPGDSKIFFITDSGLNVAPDLEQKKDILRSSIEVITSLGVESPKVAVLTANEQVSDKIPATVDAARLVDYSHELNFPDAVVEGPIAMDVALDPEKARHKGIESRVSGMVDLYLVSNIEVGNVMGKTLCYYAKARMAGMVVGAASPVIVTSRGETAEGKIFSMALAKVVSVNAEKKKI